jgi:hypothetical protein
MKRAKYLLVPVLVTLVVLVVSLYPTETITRKASAAPRAAVVSKYLMVPVAAFVPETDGIGYLNFGPGLETSSNPASFYAPLNLPSGARIRAIRLMGKDFNDVYDLCAYLYESYPKIGGAISVESVCTTGNSGKQQPIKFLSHYVKWYYGYYIWLEFNSSSSLTAYAVLIKYTVRQ